MAQDIPISITENKGLSRVDWDYTFLSVSSLPYFIAEKLKASWKGLWPEVELTYDNPNQDVRTPGITWNIFRRTAGKGNVTTLKPEWLYDTVREESKDVISVWRQYFTVTYEFTIHARDGFDLHRIVEDFELFIQNIVPDLQKRNVENFFFEEEIKSSLIATGRQLEIPKRTLRYTAHLQKRTELVHSMLESIELETRAGTLEQVDIVVRRDRKNQFDYLPLETGPFLLTCVADIPLDDLLGEIRLSSSTGGLEGVKYTTSQHLYLPEQDYIVGDIEDAVTGVKKPAIWWLDKPGSKVPLKGTVYYLSVRTSKVVFESIITRLE